MLLHCCSKTERTFRALDTIFNAKHPAATTPLSCKRQSSFINDTFFPFTTNEKILFKDNVFIVRSISDEKALKFKSATSN